MTDSSHSQSDEKSGEKNLPPAPHAVSASSSDPTAADTKSEVITEKFLTVDPYPMITLTAGADTIKPLPQIHVKDIKTFYRKEEPVSIMFYCAFPRAALTPDSNSLSLSFRSEKGKADIAWDLRSLRASSLSP